MAIIREAKKMTIRVTGEHHIRAGKLTEIAEKINIEATHDNLFLISNKKVQKEGEKK